MSWQQDFGNPPGGYKGEFSAGDAATPPTRAAGAGAGTSHHPSASQANTVYGVNYHVSQ